MPLKEWPENHPKAKAMLRRRAEILDAAKKVFLKTGYAGTSMEAIAVEAGISLMTLYRHAESKDDLFSAVITGACAPDDEDRQKALDQFMAAPIDEILFEAALHIQAVLGAEDTIALMRIVISEAASFPNLAALAHEGFVTHFEDFIGQTVMAKSPMHSADIVRANEASRAFVSYLIGGDVLSQLLGRPGLSAKQKRQRAEGARTEALRILDPTDLE